MTEIPEKDLQIDVYRSNDQIELISTKALRITHLPTNTVVTRTLSPLETYLEAKATLLKELKRRLDRTS